MPPASRNQRVPTGGDTPAPIAASSLDRPAAINAQKRSRSSRRAIPGRPGDLNLSRNARSDRRLPAIATFLPVVLRRLVDSALATLVAVVDDIARLALTDRHLQCRQHELGAQMRLHRPADDPTAERIEHDSEIQKAGCR